MYKNLEHVDGYKVLFITWYLSADVIWIVSVGGVGGLIDNNYNFYTWV